MKQINAEWLRDQKACEEGKDWFARQEERIAIKVVDKLILEEKLDWANWLLCRLLKRKDKIRYGIFAAQLTIENFEKIYPDDKRPRRAIEAALTYLDTPTKVNRSAAWSAARSAAWSARSAAESAESAAWSAAWSAGSAESAESARSAAESAALNRILKYGLKFLKGGK
jgi:hypothetical protein